MLQVLGCPRSASRTAIRAAYLDRMKLLHPDMNPDEDTTAQAVAINAAYLTLTEARWTAAHLPPYRADAVPAHPRCCRRILLFYTSAGWFCSATLAPLQRGHGSDMFFN